WLVIHVGDGCGGLPRGPHAVLLPTHDRIDWGLRDGSNAKCLETIAHAVRLCFKKYPGMGHFQCLSGKEMRQFRKTDRRIGDCSFSGKRSGLKKGSAETEAM